MTSPVQGPPNPFLKDFPTYPLPKGTVLHRVHDAAYAPNSFNPARSEYRFSPIWDVKNQIVPVLYAGDSQACAFMETIFRHLAGTTLARQSIRESKLRDRAYSVLATQRELRLGNLDGPSLARFRVEQQQVTATEPEFYRITARWAEGFHRADRALEGITWVSHRATPARAFLLFGDRVAEHDLAKTAPPASVLNDLPTWQALSDLTDRLNVGIPDFVSLLPPASLTKAPRKRARRKTASKPKRHR